jgi:hypothetical protein
MLEYFGVHETTGHEIYRQVTKKTVELFYLKDEETRYAQLCNVKSLWARTRGKKRFVGE